MSINWWVEMCMKGSEGSQQGKKVSIWSPHSGTIYAPNQMQLTGDQKKGNYIIILCNYAGIAFFAEGHGEPNSMHCFISNLIQPEENREKKNILILDARLETALAG